jgi:hypothetical protein
VGLDEQSHFGPSYGRSRFEAMFQVSFVVQYSEVAFAFVWFQSAAKQERGEDRDIKQSVICVGPQNK